jgi:hypothetical protein
MKRLTAFLAALLPFAAFAQDATAQAPDAVLDPDLQKGLDALVHAFSGPDGHISWIVLAPAIVVVAMFYARRKGADAIPWLGSKMGGVVLATASAVALSALDFALSGGKFSLAALSLIAFKTAYGSFTGAKLDQLAQARTAAKAAAATVTSTSAALNQIDPK